MSEPVTVVSASQRTTPAAAQTPGMVREQAIAEDGVWAGVVRTAPGTFSGWHHHNEHDTYAYVMSGRIRMEFGPGGNDALEAESGDWLHIPKETVHREGNPGAEDAMLALVRVGTGEVVVNVDGPEPG